VAKTYRGALLLALVIPLLLPTAAAAAVPSSVTKGLDWLHTRQRTDGGFSYTSTSGNPVNTPWIMLAIAAGHNGPGHWKVDGHSAVTFLQDTALDTAAKNSGNAPEYYALCILAYRAAGRTDLLTSAGSTQIDLIGKLKSYQSVSDGYYSPATPATTDSATETTAWAVLGLIAAHQSGPSVSSAVSWLQQDPTNGGGGPNATDGGYGSSPRVQSSTTVTSLVMQALRAGGVAKSDSDLQGAAAFIESMQVTQGASKAEVGGFEDTAFGFANAPSTAWAIEGLSAVDIDAHKLTQGGRTPYTFLRSLRHRNGSTYEFTGGDIGNVLNSTTQATIALAGAALWPTIDLTHNVATHFDPSFVSGSVAPKGGARFAGRTVEIKASYRDNVDGTGIRTSTIRVTVDGKSKTKAAHISSSHLSLLLTKLANGSHTFIIRIRDWAGNEAHVQRSFTIAVPTGGGSTGGGTHPGGSTGSGSGSGSSGSGSGSGSGTTSHSTPTPKATISPTQTVSPGATLTPTPGSSFPATGSVSPSPSATVVGQVTGSGGSGGSGRTAAVVGTTLAALVPLGFAASWLVRRHLMGVMAGASRGEILQGGSSAWQRFWKSAGGPPPAHGGE
jgi:hypothetical protein